MPKINVDSAYFNHPKVRRLKTYCGQEGDIYPIRLWAFCAEYFPKDGVMKGYTGSEIEGILGWQGADGNLMHALEKCGFIDVEKPKKSDSNVTKSETLISVHDWKIHASFIIRYSKHGKQMAEKRWKSKTSTRKLRYATSNATASKFHATGNAIELNRIELNTTTVPAVVVGVDNSVDNLPKPNKEPKPETDLQKIVRGWKILNSIPTEGPESQTWDKVHFPRNARSAKSLLDLFGTWENAAEAMEYVYMNLTAKKLSCTLETIVKHSDLYREYKEGRAVR